MKQTFLILLAITIGALASCTQKQVSVACIGDSITEGDGLAFQSKSSYPVVLDSLLPDHYHVLNCGRSSTTMLKDGNFPYWTSKDLHNIFTYKPDVIIIKLGTNDTKPINWDETKFEADYASFIDTLLSLPSDPEIFLCLPVPAFRTRWGINDSTLTQGVIPAISRLAQKYQLPVIDLYTTLKPLPQHFPDGIHPNEAGAYQIALEVARHIHPE